jgi:catechol 2,3-dioxygenase-like lactoylglutathione lyase family enzyme
MALKRMDNVGIVVDDLGTTIDFFRELGLEPEGRATIEGEWADGSLDWATSMSKLL